MDMVHDALDTGRGIRILALVDGHTRESPAWPVHTSISSRLITRALERLIETRDPGSDSMQQWPGVQVGTCWPGARIVASG